jgi:non-canonical purine NTP pyrophosphatase (RdgB/HAM1 family)
MNSISFVTGNKDKYEKAKQRLDPLGIHIEQVELTITEPQEENILKVAESKAEQAFAQLKSPILVADSGWSIPALKGFPGPFMHYVSDWFSAEDFLNLMQDKTDRKVLLQNVIAYKDEKILKVFEATRNGEILTEVKGEGIPIDQIATFRKDKKAIVECQKLGISSFDEDGFKSVWEVFGEWYNSESPQN